MFIIFFSPSKKKTLEYLHINSVRKMFVKVALGRPKRWENNLAIDSGETGFEDCEMDGTGS